MRTDFLFLRVRLFSESKANTCMLYICVGRLWMEDARRPKRTLRIEIAETGQDQTHKSSCNVRGEGLLYRADELKPQLYTQY